MPYRDQDRRKQYASEYYQKHRKRLIRRNNALQKVRYREQCDKVAEIKSSRTCVACGESDPDVLDFHHRNTEQKDDAVSRMLYVRAPWKRILAEIAKCDVLCANCHRRQHAQEKRKKNGQRKK